MNLGDDVVKTMACKTSGASTAFIEELMRRAAQFVLQEGSENTLTLAARGAALEEIVLLGGAFNLKLLGAEAVAPTTGKAVGVIALRLQ